MKESVCSEEAVLISHREAVQHFPQQVDHDDVMPWNAFPLAMQTVNRAGRNAKRLKLHAADSCAHLSRMRLTAAPGKSALTSLLVCGTVTSHAQRAQVDADRRAETIVPIHRGYMPPLGGLSRQ